MGDQNEALSVLKAKGREALVQATEAEKKAAHLKAESEAYGKKAQDLGKQAFHAEYLAGRNEAAGQPAEAAKHRQLCDRMRAESDRLHHLGDERAREAARLQGEGFRLKNLARKFADEIKSQKSEMERQIVSNPPK